MEEERSRTLLYVQDHVRELRSVYSFVSGLLQIVIVLWLVMAAAFTFVLFALVQQGPLRSEMLLSLLETIATSALGISSDSLLPSAGRRALPM